MTINESTENPLTTTEPPPPPQAGQAEAASSNGAEDRLSERHRTALKLYAQYKDGHGGSTNWKQAFIDHPDARKILGNNPTAIIATLRRSGKVPGEQAKPAPNDKRSHATKGVRKVLKVLSPKNQQLMDLMLECADANGNLDWEMLDARKPGWDNQFPSRKWVRMTASGYKTSGLLAAHRQAKSSLHPIAERLAGTAATGASRNHIMNPTMRKILELMLKHGDANGNVNIKQLDAADPHWQRGGLDRKKVGNAIIYYRRSGAFKKYKASLARLSTTAIASPEIPAGVSAKTSTQGAGELERLVEVRAMEKLHDILARAGFCMCCGNNLRAQFMAAGFEMRHK